MNGIDWHVDLGVFGEFATALLIGLLVGIEREKRKNEEGHSGIGGLRTFGLFALLGALVGWFVTTLSAPWILAAAIPTVTAVVMVGYVLEAHGRSTHLGLTTELGALAVFLLGATVTLGQRELAVGLAVVTAALLAYKDPLHALVTRLGWDDVFAGLRLLLATFIILPLLPDRTIDPWGAINPAKLWLLVILISGLSLIGYVATRWLGAHRGTAITGLTGGLVSSTAVTLSFARRSREDGAAGESNALAAGILVAWTVMFVRVLVEVAIVNADLLRHLWLPFGAMGLVTAILTGIYYWRGGQASPRGGQDGEVPLTNPFSLTSAIQFAAFFAVVLLVVKIVGQLLPGQGIYAVAVLAGLTEVDAITLSMAEYGKANDAMTAVVAIVLASLANTVTKAGFVVALGGPALRWPVLLATAVIVAAGLAAVLLY